MPKRTRSRERFPIGEWAHSVKCKCLEAVEASRSLEHIQQQITGVKETTRILKENNAQLHDEVNELKRKRGLLEDEKVHLPRGSQTTIPTKLDVENSDCMVGLSHNTASKRRKLTVNAATKIHSCSKSPDASSKTATLNGLWNTFVSYANNKDIVKLCSNSRKINTLVVPNIVNDSVANFERSTKNYERSVSVIYRGGIISKRKYNELRSSEMFEFDIHTKKRRRTEFKQGCKVPSLVPYKDVMKFISEQNIGTLHNIPQASAASETEKESEDVVQNLLPLVPGYFIDLQERLLQMANLYLHIESHRPNFLTWFGKEKGNFLVAIGADGAPFGKANEACAWLVSFLNVLERVSSPYDNFLICGGNCAEDHPSMIDYGKLLRSQISILENQVFTVKGQQVCQFIANLKSRQEYEPILGPLVQNAKSDSLHVGNNCWGHWHKRLFTKVMEYAKVGTNVKTVFQLPENNASRKYLKTLRFKMKCKKLYNKVLRWFKEKRKNCDFEFRFTGEETKKFCNGFMYLTEDLVGEGSDIEQPQNLFALSMARMGLHLRNGLSLAVRVSDIKKEDLPKLEEDCRLYFNLASIFHTTNVSVWTMGHCVPFHTRQLIEDLGVGLGINSMQGREAKHQQLASFAEFSLVKNRWDKVFRHEHMSLFWLREQNPLNDNYSKCKDNYIPQRCYTNEYCFCGIAFSSNGKCKYCQSALSKEIATCASSGSITKNESNYEAS
ncbi:hypothetical protein OS493_019411 [Desmophyllum pertusum]|uniref:Uncharacterized protein n=1 Tax=Desmophyllum pertusum TaxID=174260 RepID=A0A9X0A1U8_9CNID|nr:hypothetical protein OS493_019411 [Desmophyllum pertusum]